MGDKITGKDSYYLVQGRVPVFSENMSKEGFTAFVRKSLGAIDSGVLACHATCSNIDGVWGVESHLCDILVWGFSSCSSVRLRCLIS